VTARWPAGSISMRQPVRRVSFFSGASMIPAGSAGMPATIAQ